MHENVLLLGVGNLLLSDEGLGIHVVQQLEATPLPDHVEVVDGGTGGFELLECFRGKKKIIIVDAIAGDAEPGTLLRIRGDELELEPRRPLSSHQTTIEELVRFARQLDSPPEIVVIGVVPSDKSSLSMSLTQIVSAKVPAIIGAIMAEISLPSLTMEQ